MVSRSSTMVLICRFTLTLETAPSDALFALPDMLRCGTINAQRPDRSADAAMARRWTRMLAEAVFPPLAHIADECSEARHRTERLRHSPYQHQCFFFLSFFFFSSETSPKSRSGVRGHPCARLLRASPRSDDDLNVQISGAKPLHFSCLFINPLFHIAASSNSNVLESDGGEEGSTIPLSHDNDSAEAG